MSCPSFHAPPILKGFGSPAFALKEHVVDVESHQSAPHKTSGGSVGEGVGYAVGDAVGYPVGYNESPDSVGDAVGHSHPIAGGVLSMHPVGSRKLSMPPLSTQDGYGTLQVERLMIVSATYVPPLSSQFSG